ncbi:hypothetical protein HD553DRAFT_340220 [Filobasidium floriforme]|uniref:uncharacterized protein n=1 Tax=Filobasidium floriforme TaxID=5210 RepID=UPI001E8D86CD|nr:uncharacterized protein HD553DRAFT_340220 [Filobasidium floriforme]KAH8088103.1 hypothetical protein HD553DRAFT_340220 [Filobasidium floriforme]
MGASQSSGKVTKNDKAILDLKVQRDKLKQYQKRLTVNLETEQNAAKQALTSGNKSRALTALRQRKFQESLLIKTDGQLQTITELVRPTHLFLQYLCDIGGLSTIEFSQLQNQVLLSLQNGSQVLGELQKEMSLERAESIVDRVGEGVAAQREIDEALMSKMSPEEEEAVQAEFAQLEREARGETVEDVEKRQKIEDRLPAVPSTVPQVDTDEAYEVDRVRQNRQREEDLKTIALPS